MKLNINMFYSPAVRWLERGLALAMLVGVLIAAVNGGITM